MPKEPHNRLYNALAGAMRLSRPKNTAMDDEARIKLTQWLADIHAIAAACGLVNTAFKHQYWLDSVIGRDATGECVHWATSAGKCTTCGTVIDGKEQHV